jgi:T5orf172 domain
LIYFIEDPVKHLIKIGTTIRLSVRLAQLRSKHGPGLQVLGVTAGSYADERVLHDRFRLLREDGEWFKVHEILTDFIEREAQPWDGMDEVPSPKDVNMEYELVVTAKRVATLKGVSLTEYLNNLLKPIVEADYRKHIEESYNKLNSKPV